MSHTNPNPSSQKELYNITGKIGRTNYREWVKVCPQCFSPNIQPLTNISGTLIQEQWFCSECGYAGVTIEVKTEDLIRFRLQQLARIYNRNQKTRSF
ncbi:MAG: hypothetical protein ACFE9D_08925 [Promethearchaeota archaeon]